MKIYLEWDDGERRYLGNGGARHHRAMLKKHGYKNNVIVAYHKNVVKLTGHTYIWPTETLVREGCCCVRIKREWKVWQEIMRW
jgi:hypothetical protein